MKKYLLTLFLFINVEVSAQVSMKPLDDYITEQGGVDSVLQDTNALSYVTSRCAGFFLFYAGAVQNLADGSLTDLYADKATNLMFIYLNMHAAAHKESEIDSDVINDYAINQIQEIKNLYRSDMEQNYINTGENIIGSYLEEELLLCDKMNQLFEVLQSGSSS